MNNKPWESCYEHLPIFLVSYGSFHFLFSSKVNHIPYFQRAYLVSIYINIPSKTHISWPIFLDLRFASLLDVGSILYTLQTGCWTANKYCNYVNVGFQEDVQRVKEKWILGEGAILSFLQCGGCLLCCGPDEQGIQGPGQGAKGPRHEKSVFSATGPLGASFCRLLTDQLIDLLAELLIICFLKFNRAVSACTRAVARSSYRWLSFSWMPWPGRCDPLCEDAPLFRRCLDRVTSVSKQWGKDEKWKKFNETIKRIGFTSSFYCKIGGKE